MKNFSGLQYCHRDGNKCIHLGDIEEVVLREDGN